MTARRLTAILAADIAGYSSLMGANDVETVAALKGHQSVILPMISGYSGRVIDTAGDGILAEFGSVYNAVKCALAIQEIMSERNASQPPDKRMQFRIGINQGDVLFDDDRIYGDGINVAARLEGICQPGGICISGKVYEEIRGKFEVRYEDIGEQVLKNISIPVRTYQISVSGTTPNDQKRTVEKQLIAAGAGLAVFFAAVAGWWYFHSTRLNTPAPSTPAPVEMTTAKPVPSPPQTSPKTNGVVTAVAPREAGKDDAKKEPPPESQSPPAVTAASSQKEIPPTVPPGGVKQDALDEGVVRALASRLGIPLPVNIKIVTPEPTTPATIAEYLGVWGGEARWGGNGRQIVLGLMSVDTKGVAYGFYASGPPTATGYSQSPAYYIFFSGTVDHEGLKFEGGGGRFKYHFKIVPGGYMLGNFRAPPASKGKSDVNSIIHLERIGR